MEKSNCKKYLRILFGVWILWICILIGTIYLGPSQLKEVARNYLRPSELLLWVSLTLLGYFIIIREWAYPTIKSTYRNSKNDKLRPVKIILGIPFILSGSYILFTSVYTFPFSQTLNAGLEITFAVSGLMLLGLFFVQKVLNLKK